MGKRSRKKTTANKGRKIGGEDILERTKKRKALKKKK